MPPRAAPGACAARNGGGRLAVTASGRCAPCAALAGLALRAAQAPRCAAPPAGRCLASAGRDAAGCALARLRGGQSLAWNRDRCVSVLSGGRSATGAILGMTQGEALAGDRPGLRFRSEENLA